LFTGARFAPAALSEQEAAHLAAPAPPEADLIRADWPDWLWPPLETALGPRAQAVAAAMRGRAPFILRVNIARIPRAGAIDRLAAEGITAEPHPLAETALQVTAGARGIARSAAYLEGLVELQDAASQAAVALVPLATGDRVLDYCAGGGGKALAIAARAPRAVVSAHDADAARMRDIGPRAARAGAKIAVLVPGAAIAAQDLVVVDAPCSGSGTWRRTPEAKWRLTPERLAELVALQASILDEAAAHVRPGGHLAYFTCSLFDAENVDQIQAFVARSGWSETARRRFDPTEGGDGFFAAIVQRPTA
ncbi:MAG: RsmB/NOP family class I SAM-dependent RNA methyltransferase, partial [Sphingomonadales bacterium]|nr:RsmB/NOP family class I SAM-dependent RNA methyltransferase [Sphingomonadales bacterium]